MLNAGYDICQRQLIIVFMCAYGSIKSRKYKVSKVNCVRMQAEVCKQTQDEYFLYHRFEYKIVVSGIRANYETLSF
jgi:hypothetical protein